MEKIKIQNSEKFPIYKHTTTISGKKVSREIIGRPDIAAIVAIEDTKIIDIHIVLLKRIEK